MKTGTLTPLDSLQCALHTGLSGDNRDPSENLAHQSHANCVHMQCLSGIALLGPTVHLSHWCCLINLERTRREEIKATDERKLSFSVQGLKFQR